ncbi:MAG: tRNA(adenine34) deaminase [Claussenomyces sp. TS43310]|nr:MAG: tRNA(adenine34) deaminase [Claussenomyces sp. TS43310]
MEHIAGSSGDANRESCPDGSEEEERQVHEAFMREALAMAELALATDETPVGCVFVHNGQVIARGMNATNRTLNGTRHAEFMAIASLLSSSPSSPALAPTAPEDPTLADVSADVSTSAPSAAPEQYTAAVLHECDLYVTVEPCIMCASLLRQYQIRKVYFGAVNDRFGGTGGVLNIHDAPGVDPAYPVSGGWLREEAIMLLRRFYVQQNEKAPEPKNKKERKLKTDIEPMSKPASRNVQ